MAATDVYARDMSDARMAALEGCRVPFEFVENGMKALCNTDFRLWVFIKSRQSAEGLVPLSLESIASALDIHVGTASASARRLSALGLLYGKRGGFGTVKSYRVFDSKEAGEVWMASNT